MLVATLTIMAYYTQMCWTIFVWEKHDKINICPALSPFGARLSMSPLRREISSSEAAEKSYSALATTWSSSPLAQLVAEWKNTKQRYLLKLGVKHRSHAQTLRHLSGCYTHTKNNWLILAALCTTDVNLWPFPATILSLALSRVISDGCLVDII